MSEVTIQDRLKEANGKVKTLSSSLEQIRVDARVEEEKLKTAYTNLTQLGVEGAENMSAKELQALADELQGKLAEKLQEIEGQLAKGEQLMQKYQQLQES